MVLSTAVLAVSRIQNQRTDWVTLEAYAGLLDGHPSVGKVWAFSKNSGLKGWLKLLATLAAQDYDEVLDLHGSVRTRLARIYFWLHPRGRRAAWRFVRKERWRNWGYYVFKSLWPRALRPRPQVVRFAEAAGGAGWERPDLRHLLKETPSERVGVSVMPSAKGAGKTWDTERWVRLLSAPALVREPIVVLGTQADRLSVELLEHLKKRLATDAVQDGLSLRSYSELAQVIASKRQILSVDTGLAHLAEALGVPSVVLFGPTSPEQGFGPWRAESRAVHSPLWCSPCGRDGRMCFRLHDRFACQKKLSVESVQATFEAQ